MAIKWNPWEPMNEPIDVKHLGKLLEELGEAVAATSRCLIQGIDEHEPVTGKWNKEWLEDELADVKANMKLVEEHFCLDVRRMEERQFKKEHYLSQWHNALEE